VLPLYVLTLFTSALLVFIVQPMFSKLVLPYLGGTPAVWNACMLFFQTGLLCGYSYAHLSARVLSGRWQRALHVILLAGSLVFLPIALPSGWAPSPTLPEAFSVVGVLLLSVGIPFVLLSSTAPMLQHWFAGSDHDAAHHPYFLYAASNAGSLLALFIFPAVLEPTLPSDGQRWLWSGAYALLVLLIAACAIMTPRRQIESPKADGPAPTAFASVTTRHRVRWILLAAVPSSLLLGVTTFLTTDVAAVPLLWVIPLALYLLSFVLTFARRRVLRHEWMLSAQTLLAILVALQLFWRASLPSWYPFALLLLLLFVTAMVCHGELVRCAPDRKYLTEFYLWIAAGGAVGGLFNALVAPFAFKTVAELPIALAAACLMRPTRDRSTGHANRQRWLDIVVPAFVAVGLAIIALIRGLTLPENFPIGFLVVSFGVALVLIFSSGRSLRFGLTVAVLLLAGHYVASADSDVLFAQRNFFGVHQVRRDAKLNAHLLLNGTTLHGAQLLDPGSRRIPQTYYHPDGPLGQAMASLPERGGRRVAAIGLGSGAVSCYARPSDRWVFYEIDPGVIRIARDTSLFTFLRDCAPDAGMVVGDARLRIREAPSNSFDVIILDAFTSDAIPVHLLTREAMVIYRDKLSPDGILLVHLSNRFMDLAPVVARAAGEAGMHGLLGISAGSASEGAMRLASEATWAILTRTRSSLGALVEDPRWVELRARSNTDLWTDDFSNILGVLVM
jgi:hypothetical protein